MNKGNELIISYWKEVNRHLNCSNRLRKALRTETIRHIERTVKEDPADTMEQLIEAFGEQEDFAESLMAGLERDEIETGIKYRRCVRYGIIICTVLVVLGLSVLAVYLKLNRDERKLVKEIIIYAEEETPSDFWELPDGTPLEEGEGVEVSAE